MGPQSTEIAIAGLTEVAGWEALWLTHKNDPDDPAEKDKRHGRVHELADEEGRFVVTVLFPAWVPNHPLKFRYGAPDAMPEYKIRVELNDNVYLVHASMEDPLVSQLCDYMPDFPKSFTMRFDLTEPVRDSTERYWNRMLVTQLVKVATAEEALGAHKSVEMTGAAPIPPEGLKVEWRAHYITSECVGCTICDIKCPTHAISGVKKLMYVIEPELCINCGVCGVYCPYDAIVDQFGDLVKRIKAKDIPKAVVIPDLCSGCEYCIDVCPFDCIHLVPAPNSDGESGHMSSKIATVDEKTCVSCGICETFCIKEAIIVDRKFQWNDQIGFSFQEGRLVPHPNLPALPEG